MARRLSERKAVERPGVEWAKRRGVLVTKGGAEGQNGWPDRVFWFYGGKPFMPELKSPGEAPRPLQAFVHKQLRDLRYDVEVFDNETDFLEALEARHAAARKARKKDGADS